MKIAIVTAAHKRTNIFKNFLRHLKPAFEHLNALLICATTDDEHKEALALSGHPFEVVEAPNNPLGAKFNATLPVARAWGADYVIGLGSDDILSPGLWQLYGQLVRESFHYIGIEDMFLFNTETGAAKYYRGYNKDRQGDAMGVGRCVHKNVLAVLNWELWQGDANRGLDKSLDEKLRRLQINKFLFRCRDYGQAVVDLKSNVNLWNFDAYVGEPVKPTELQAYFDEPLYLNESGAPTIQRQKKANLGKNDLTIVSCTWGRPELTKLFVEQLRRLKKEQGVNALIVDSEGNEFKGVPTFQHPNKPLGAKWNFAVKKAFEFGATNVLLLGSDDFISNSLIENYKSILKACPSVELLGVVDGYFYDTKSKKLIYWGGYQDERFGNFVGMGKVVRKSLFTKLGGKLFDPRANRALDASFDKRVRVLASVERRKIFCKGTPVVDVKHKHNVTPFSLYPNARQVPIDAVATIKEFDKITSIKQ